MDVAEYDPRRWATSGVWAVEPQGEALARAPDFARRFFAEVFGRFPVLSASATFLRWSEQPDDVYAVFDLPGRGFGVQADPDLEYLIVWGTGGQAEHGSWGGDQVAPALEHVGQLVAGGD
jgi:hypothetical protein